MVALWNPLLKAQDVWPWEGSGPKESGLGGARSEPIRSQALGYKVGTVAQGPDISPVVSMRNRSEA